MTQSIIGGSSGGGTTDVTDRAGRALGIVVQGAAGASLWKVDASGAAVPVTDNGGSLTVDSAQLPTLVSGRLPVDASGVTQPVSAVTLPLPSGAATEATLGNVSKDATLTGGTQKSIQRGGAKGATAAADVTSTAEGADHQALDAQVYHGGAAIDPRDVSDRGGRVLGVVDTELPAAAAQADGAAAPTAPAVLSHLKLRNASSTFDDVRAAPNSLAGSLSAGVLAAGIQLATGSALAPLFTASGIGDGSTFTGGLPIGEWAYNGATWDRWRRPNVFKSFATTAVTAGTGVTLWTPTSGKKFRLMGWLISLTVSGQILFGDNAIGTVIARTPTLAAAGVHTSPDLGNGMLSATANNVLKADVSATGSIAGMVWGTEE